MSSQKFTPNALLSNVKLVQPPSFAQAQEQIGRIDQANLTSWKKDWGWFWNTLKAGREMLEMTMRSTLEEDAVRSVRITPLPLICSVKFPQLPPEATEEEMKKAVESGEFRSPNLERLAREDCADGLFVGEVNSYPVIGYEFTNGVLLWVPDWDTYFLTVPCYKEQYLINDRWDVQGALCCRFSGSDQRTFHWKEVRLVQNLSVTRSYYEPINQLLYHIAEVDFHATLNRKNKRSGSCDYHSISYLSLNGAINYAHRLEQTEVEQWLEVASFPLSRPERRYLCELLKLTEVETNSILKEWEMPWIEREMKYFNLPPVFHGSLDAFRDLDPYKEKDFFGEGRCFWKLAYRGEEPLSRDVYCDLLRMILRDKEVGEVGAITFGSEATKALAVLEQYKPHLCELEKTAEDLAVKIEQAPDPVKEDDDEGWDGDESNDFSEFDLEKLDC